MLVLYNADVLNALARSCLWLIEGMEAQTDAAVDTWLPALLVMMQSPLNGEPTYADTIVPKLHKHLLKVRLGAVVSLQLILYSARLGWRGVLVLRLRVVGCAAARLGIQLMVWSFRSQPVPRSAQPALGRYPMRGAAS
jgi:hypothetical protein